MKNNKRGLRNISKNIRLDGMNKIKNIYIYIYLEALRVKFEILQRRRRIFLDLFMVIWQKIFCIINKWEKIATIYDNI